MQQLAEGEHHGHHLKNPTPSVDAYLLQEQSRKISSGSDLKRQILGFLKSVAQTRRTARWYWISSWSRKMR